MENKKELMIWLAILGIIFLFILFMPQIEKLLSGKYHFGKKKVAKQEVEKVTYPQATECDLSETPDPDKNATISKQVKFTYTSSGTVESIVLVTLSKYNNEKDYQKYKAEKNNTRAGVITQITTDDSTKSISKKEIMTIKDMNDLTEYPTGYTNLKKYLSQNKYVCTEKS